MDPFSWEKNSIETNEKTAATKEKNGSKHIGTHQTSRIIYVNSN